MHQFQVNRLFKGICSFFYSFPVHLAVLKKMLHLHFNCIEILIKNLVLLTVYRKLRFHSIYIEQCV